MATSAAAGSRGQARLTRRFRPGPGTRPVPARAPRGRARALVTATPQARDATRGWAVPVPGRPARRAGPACAAPPCAATRRGPDVRRGVTPVLPAAAGPGLRGGPVLGPAAPAGGRAGTGPPGAAQGAGDDEWPAGLDR